MNENICGGLCELLTEIPIVSLGTLRGYYRHAVRDQDFPALVPSPTSVRIVLKSFHLNMEGVMRFLVLSSNETSQDRWRGTPKNSLFLHQCASLRCNEYCLEHWMVVSAQSTDSDIF